MNDESYFRHTGYFKIDHAARNREDAQRARATINRLSLEAVEGDKACEALESIIRAYGKCTCKDASCIRCIAEIGLGRLTRPSPPIKASGRGALGRSRRGRGGGHRGPRHRR
jgi:hypothetical protein